jgi:hypothetical protein
VLAAGFRRLASAKADFCIPPHSPPTASYVGGVNAPPGSINRSQIHSKRMSEIDRLVERSRGRGHSFKVREPATDLQLLLDSVLTHYRSQLGCFVVMSTSDTREAVRATIYSRLVAQNIITSNHQHRPRRRVCMQSYNRTQKSTPEMACPCQISKVHAAPTELRMLESFA